MALFLSWTVSRFREFTYNRIWSALERQLLVIPRNKPSSVILCPKWDKENTVGSGRRIRVTISVQLHLSHKTRQLLHQTRIINHFRQHPTKTNKTPPHQLSYLWPKIGPLTFGLMLFGYFPHDKWEGGLHFVKTLQQENSRGRLIQGCDPKRSLVINWSSHDSCLFDYYISLDLHPEFNSSIFISFVITIKTSR